MTKATKQHPDNDTGANWLVKNRDLNWEVEGAFFDEMNARGFCEEWNSHPDVNREQMKVFYEG